MRPCGDNESRKLPLLFGEGKEKVWKFSTKGPHGDAGAFFKIAHFASAIFRYSLTLQRHSAAPIRYPFSVAFAVVGLVAGAVGFDGEVRKKLMVEDGLFFYPAH